MPRIELIPASYNPSSGDGSPTVDCCARCARHFTEGSQFPYDSLSLPKEMVSEPEVIVGSVDVMHPGWDENRMSGISSDCEFCGKPLKDGRDD